MNQLKCGYGLLAGLLLAFCACSSSNPLAPFQPEVTNTTDSFQLQATKVVNVTMDKSYLWKNTGTQATVNHATITTAGKARVTISDANGAIVYDKTLASSLNETTSAGATGTWTIRVRLTSYGGTLNFRVQKV